MHSSTYMPGDLVTVKQGSWITDKDTWALKLTTKPYKGIFLGKFESDCTETTTDCYFAHPYPARIMVDGNREIIVDLSKINYYTKRRNYEKVN